MCGLIHFVSLFIYDGFGTAREVLDEEDGDLDFNAYQENRIVSLDESLDNTACNKGGHPAMSFYDPEIQDAPQAAAHKNSYGATGMYGCTMGGAANCSSFCFAYRGYAGKPANQQVI